MPVLRFLCLWAIGDGAGHIQSLVVGGALLVIGFVTLLIGLVADLISFNRQLLEIVLEKLRRSNSKSGAARRSRIGKPCSAGRAAASKAEQPPSTPRV